MTNAQQLRYVQLIEENEGIIHKVIGLYVDDSEDRKDLYQEVLLQAWKSFPRFKGHAAFSTWLYKVCLNTVLTFRKKAAKRPSGDEAALERMTAEPKEEHELLYYLIRQLDEVDRMIMSLHLDGYKNHEIAEITGISNNHLNVKIHRLKNKIIEAFKKATHGSL